MGATRKLQGEIDRVLKKVQEGVEVFDGIWNKVYETENTNQKEKFEADLKKEIKKLQRYRDQIKTWIQSSEIKDKKVAASYEQALLEARKVIEREMERFKVCEKETKTKAFSKEGLGQQPKTDPREKARTESREWLNNMVSELEAQVDTFEAEMEGLAVKKGKSRPPRLIHLEESAGRHKSHIMKLEHILRLLDNDELSPEQVSDVKDLVEDYVERNQDDFDEFADVDEIYNQLPLDKLEESLDAVPNVASALIVKEKAAVAAASSNGLNSKVSLPSQAVAAAQAAVAAAATNLPAVAASTAESSSTDGPIESPRNASDGSLPSTPHRTVVTPPGLATGRTTKTASMVVSGVKPKEDDAAVRRLGVDGGLTRSFSRSTSQPPLSPLNVTSGPPAGTTGSEVAKRSSGTDSAQQLASPLSVRPLSQGVSKTADSTATTEGAGFSETGVVGNRLFSSSVSQWRTNPSESGQLPGRTEFAPDQKQQFLKKLQQVQEEASHLASPSQKQQLLASSQTSALMQQALLQQQQQQQQHSSLIRGSQPMVTQPLPLAQQRATSPQLPVTATSQQLPDSAKEVVQSQSGPRISESPQQQISAQQQQQIITVAEEAAADTTMGFTRTVSTNEDDLKNADTFDVSVGGPGTLAELSQLSRDADFTPGQQLPMTPGRRTGTELGAIGDNLSTVQDHAYNLQLLESAFRNLPLPKDSERPRSYTPRTPAKVPIPASYPQEPVPFSDNPALWEKFETDVLFFVFYYQQGTYQQYLAAKELKKQFWRYHKRYNTWFQRHEEPKVTTDEYEQGTYVYFDCNIGDDLQQGWVQRIKTEFTFEYGFLEDELVV